MSAIWRSTCLLYTAPVGLFGLMTTMAFVFFEIFDRMSSRSGFQPSASLHR